MPTVNKVVAGVQIEIDADDNVRVGGKEIVYEARGESGKFASNYLPYTEYDSLETMAEAIATQTEEFRSAG